MPNDHTITISVDWAANPPRFTYSLDGDAPVPNLKAEVDVNHTIKWKGTQFLNFTIMFKDDTPVEDVTYTGGGSGNTAIGHVHNPGGHPKGADGNYHYPYLVAVSALVGGNVRAASDDPEIIIT